MTNEVLAVGGSVRRFTTHYHRTRRLRRCAGQGAARRVQNLKIWACGSET